ncbi:unnamed protein product [Spodoptera littoralis]|uniref:G-protein coupled receptors family 1 profile domain-containing protein n=1 Tax=Spodoptera littoralis TaxID=7109 RepID=A0A9P0IKK1_SPOLI|nr:unnamed protein product [Spodoptera littoralis]CAH1647917.1 unnamed protein product [Spodoptera littoralis]
MTNMAANNVTAPSTRANNQNVYYENIETVASILYVYYTPLLVLLGSVGNIISVYVFFTSKLRLQSTSLYLSALALSDTLFLQLLLPPWLDAIQITTIFHKSGFCQVFVYSSYTACCLSAWLVVAFTIERFVAVLYPLRRNSMCTVTRAKVVILLLLVGSLIANIPLIKFASPSINDCNIDDDYIEHAARFNLADTIVSFSFPLGIIIIFNIWIVVGVYQRAHERRELNVERAAWTEYGCDRAAMTARALPPLRSQHRVTRMLLIVSTVFVALNLPAYTMRLLAYAYDLSSDEYSGRWAALQQLSLLFFNTNFGINFILYCLTGQNFRRELCQSIPCLRTRVRRDELRLTCRNAARTGSVTGYELCAVHMRPRMRRNSCGGHTASYVSCTEASTSISAGREVSMGSDAPCNVRRHRSEPLINRWNVVMSRQLRHQDQGTAGETTQEHDPATPDVVPTGQSQETATEQRRIPYLFFPYRNLIASKRGRPNPRFQ